MARGRRGPQMFERDGDGWMRPVDAFGTDHEPRDRFPVCTCPKPRGSGRFNNGVEQCRLCNYPIPGSKGRTRS